MRTGDDRILFFDLSMPLLLLLLLLPLVVVVMVRVWVLGSRLGLFGILEFLGCLLGLKRIAFCADPSRLASSHKFLCVSDASRVWGVCV